MPLNPPPWTFKDCEIHDASEQAALQSWLPLSCRQISSGRFFGHYREVDLGSFLLVNECQNQDVVKSAVTPQGVCTLSFIANEHNLERFSQYRGSSKSALYLLPADTEADILAPKDIETIYVKLSQDVLMEKLRTVNEPFFQLNPNFLQVFQGAKHIEKLTESVRVMQFLASQAINTQDLLKMRKPFLDQLVLAVDACDSVIGGNALDMEDWYRRSYIITQAKHYIDECLHKGENVSVVDLCEYFQVSARTLQYYFQVEYGLTPISYIRIERLNRARADLLNPVRSDVTVTEIATQWGFYHLSQFSKDYFSFFGEKPSETLVKALG